MMFQAFARMFCCFLPLAPFPRRDFVARPFEATFGFMQTWNSVPILSKDDAELHCYGS